MRTSRADGHQREETRCPPSTPPAFCPPDSERRCQQGHSLLRVSPPCVGGDPPPARGPSPRAAVDSMTLRSQVTLTPSTQVTLTPSG